MDYGKFKFEEAKAARAAKKKQHVIHLKEVKYRPGIDDHDFAFKTRHAREFLQDGNKVKVTMMYRGRQMAHIRPGARGARPGRQRAEGHRQDRAGPKLEGRTCRWCSPRNEPDTPAASPGGRDAQTEIQARAPQAGEADGNRSAAPLPRVQESHPDQEHPKRKRHLRKPAMVSKADEARLKRLLMV